eukprot:CFRG2975T1
MVCDSSSLTPVLAGSSTWARLVDLPPNKRYMHTERRSRKYNQTHHSKQQPGYTTYTYQLIKYLNKGSSSKVHSAVRFSNKESRGQGEIVAVKLIGRTAKNYRISQNEFKLHRKLSHGNIIDFKEYFETPNHWVCVQELMRGDMYDMLTTNKGELETDESLLMALKDVLNGLSYLHSNGIAHHDVKLENVGMSYSTPVSIKCDSVPESISTSAIFEEEQDHRTNKKFRSVAKLMDFGLSVQITKSIVAMPGFAGTTEYAAPELIESSGLNLPYIDGSDPFTHPFVRADMWAVGILLYLLLSAQTVCRFPWASAHKTDTEFNLFLKSEDSLYDSLKTTNPLFRELLNGLLKIDPEERLTAQEALNIIDRYTNASSPISSAATLTGNATSSPADRRTDSPDLLELYTSDSDICMQDSVISTHQPDRQAWYGA